MVTRYVIHVGDKTSTDGTVLTTEQQLHGAFGKGTALIGDPVYCPACKTTGQIIANGPRLPMTISGRQIALSGDLCLCKCAKLPELVAVHQKLAVKVGDSAEAAPAPVQQLAARGVSEQQEAECHAQYDADMVSCQAYRAMYGGNVRVYALCKQRAFENYQQCRGY
ncbi:PAAR domain-containing protein [Robbsia andropogonis]|uniref:PAAR domain-containing protein n=1 Tax=Robbsia andropogonis TaxID=28092 RepID=UPI000A616D60|nr:PAAR domain-containing protein [Robbsia andropogonis]